jgi:nucleoside-diphosphate-sugar epimerase
MSLDWEADEFMQFVADLEPNADGSLQIMYGIDGRRDLSETERERPEGSEVERLLAANDRAHDLLGWKPGVTLEEGLRRTIEWFGSNLDRYRSGGTYVL